MNDQLLPKFTNFKLYDVSLQHEPETIVFKKNLLNSEIKTKEQKLQQLTLESAKSLVQLRGMTVGNLQFYAIVFLLQRKLTQYQADIMFEHNKKLRDLYGGEILNPNSKFYLTNLSQYRPNKNELSLLNKGLNYCIDKPYKTLDNQVASEKLFMSILESKQKNQFTIESEDNLKIKLKSAAIRRINTERDNILTQDEKRAIKSLSNNKEIVVQRPDKGGGVVILDRQYYHDRLLNLISDPDKFSACSSDQSDNLKKEINIIAEQSKNSNKHLYFKLRRVGNFADGHLYGLPKLHKNIEAPPLRPIISMSGTVTHDIAQFLNNIIRPYLNSAHIVTSGTELLVQLENVSLQPQECLVSLDVKSLFTNVSVIPTIDIILEIAYNHPTIAPPPIPFDQLRKLLII